MAARELEAIEDQLNNMSPDEFAKDRRLKGRRTRLLNKSKLSLIPTEHQEQVRVIGWAEANLNRWPELKLLHAIPNAGGYVGGYRTNAARVASMIAEGVKSGVPDLSLPVARGVFHGLYLEMKSLNGAVKQSQREWMQMLIEQGFCSRICKGADRAIEYLTWYLEGAREPEI